MKVSLFVTCLSEVFYPNVAKDVVEVLERLGCNVDFPGGQTCCGQPAFNSGHREEAIKTAKNMIQAFENSEYIVTPSGSCAYMLQEYQHLFDEESEWQEKAITLSKKTFEFTQFIVDVLKVENIGASFPAKATYHTSCHMSRLLGVKDAPMTLLNNVANLELYPLQNCQDCCGFGGTFSVKMSSISEQMVTEKVHHIEETNADILIGADNGCLMNIKGRMNRLNKKIEVKHIAEILNQHI